MKVVVFGYHDVGCECLGALLDLGQDVPLLVTHEDDPGEQIWFGSIAEIARSAGVEVITPEDPNDPAIVAKVRAAAPDAILSCYYRQILGPDLLSLPPRGAFNVHGSLLPRYRGRAPVNWVLVHGEKETGITLHHMAEKPDRGDIVGQQPIRIDEEDTALTLHRKVARAARELMRDLWPRIDNGTAPRTAQEPALASYYGRRRPEDGRIDWSRSAHVCRNLVRAVTHPYPGAFCHAGGRKLTIWKATVGDLASKEEAGRIVSAVPKQGLVVATGQGDLIVARAQLEGHEEMAGDLLVAKGLLTVGQQLE
jgi:UDP-4-amino-4-deoxy-L-arabinose formyltransferase/UDP-glucuronic acid dehydrogenase (UDP-4-keto-hexauronic acid decarboxylating)